jgi:putative alpha-1,2-mannosidase
VDPVSGNYVFGTPLFDRAEVKLENGKTLVVEAKRNSPNDQYIQSVQFNGKPHNKLWFRHADIVNGATIVFTLGSTPNPKFGVEPGAVPPSISV